MYDEHTCIKHGPWVARSISKGGRLVERKNRGRLNGPFAGAVYLPPPANVHGKVHKKCMHFSASFTAPVTAIRREWAATSVTILVEG